MVVNFSDSVVQSLVGTGVGTLALELGRRWLDGRQARTATRDQSEQQAAERLVAVLQAQIDDLKAAQQKLAAEVESYRSRYFELARANDRLKVQLGDLRAKVA